MHAYKSDKLRFGSQCSKLHRAIGNVILTNNACKKNEIMCIRMLMRSPCDPCAGYVDDNEHIRIAFVLMSPLEQIASAAEAQILAEGENVPLGHHCTFSCDTEET